VIVTANLYGDIISDIAAEIGGSVGMCGSANIGRNVAMFEAIHGSAPDIAGRRLANPTSQILAAAMMLRHLGQEDDAALLESAVWEIYHKQRIPLTAVGAVEGGPAIVAKELKTILPSLAGRL
jgi:isocitrate/isopropylmalate dehydrogenase